MNRLTCLAAGTLLCSGAAFATTTQYAASLQSVAATPASGSAMVTLDDVALTIDVLVNFAGLSAPASAAHIHCCTLPNSGVVVPFNGFPNTASGSYQQTIALGASFATIQANIAGGTAYVNVHNAIYPGGEIRGTLAPVPEPASYAMLIFGAGVLALATRRRGRR